MNSQPSNFTDTAFAWNEDFIAAHHTVQNNTSGDKRQSLCLRLIESSVTQNPHTRQLAQQILNLEEILALRSRMIGNGLIGEKSAGIVMAEAILQKHHTTIAPLRPFFITTDVFQHYCHENGFSPSIQRYAENLPAPDPRTGVVPGNLAAPLHRILEELQGSPVVLASGQYHADSPLFLSALNSIAYILPGPIEEQTEKILQSLQRHYARHLSQHPPSTPDEQPTLLLYALPGVRDGDWFYPHLTGRGYSFNPYRWTPSLDPRQGAVRFLVGLGRENTDEFTRLLSLSDPALRPESTQEEMKQYSQKKVQLLDLKNQAPRSIAFEDLIRTSKAFPSRFFVEQENLFSHLSRETESTLQDGVFLAYNKTFRETTLLQEIEDILHTLAHHYKQECQVDFAINFQANTHTISLLACKPGNSIPASLEDNQTESLFIQAQGSVIGERNTAQVDRIIYVKPSVYGHMPNQDQYSIARLIGRLTRLKEEPPRSILLLGPGRWGTTTPSLGVPVAFAEIKKVSVLGEMISMREDLIPDVSQGTHFFSEMVDTGMMYFAFSPGEKTTLFHERHIESLPNQLTEFIPSAHRFEHCIHVVDLPGETKLRIDADILQQSITGRLDAAEEKE